MTKKAHSKGIRDISPEMYDISEVEFDMPQNKKRSQITLIASDRSGADFNLVKYYLALKEFVEKIERELDIMESSGEEQ